MKQFIDSHAIISDVMKQKESIILDQLSELISRGLLVIEEGPFTLLRSASSDRIEYRQMISLKLKDQEYIERLERENKDLLSKLQLIAKTLAESNA